MKEKPKYYDGTKLLSLMDSEGNLPDIYLCTTNRTGGKTTYFNRLLFKRFLEGKGKFMLIYRYKYELCNIADAFFGDIRKLFFPEYELTEKAMVKGAYLELFATGPGMEKESCGYAVSLSSAKNIKVISHLFCDVNRVLFDEFQSETNDYAPDELSKFMSIQKSIARGNGMQYRRVPFYMLSNAVSLLNPYYTALGISYRIQENTKFLRGPGWVMEQGYVASAAEAQRESGFNKAFAGSKYIEYAEQNIYLNDNKTFIERMTSAEYGNPRYLCTLKYKDKYFSLKEFDQFGLVYCDSSYDDSFPIKLALTVNDHDYNFQLVNNQYMLGWKLREAFEHGQFRFKNMECKECIMSLLSY